MAVRKASPATAQAQTWVADELGGLTIKVKYFNQKCKIKKIEKGDWIDLHVAESKVFAPGEYYLMPLGIAAELPGGYEAHIIPRSSTFSKYGLVLANSPGLIDESYKGDNDQWFAPFYATRRAVVNEGDRLVQFRIIEKMPGINIVEVEKLNNPDRGGHGSTGK